MIFRSRSASAALIVLWSLPAVPAGATALLPHKATYQLTLDGSKPSGQLEEMRGEIQFEISGDACTGYTTVTRQQSLASTGVGEALRQDTTSKAWEDGDARSYRFASTSAGGEAGDEKVEASVQRMGADALQVTVTQPKPATLDLKGEILLPTEHVRRVLAAAVAGDSIVHAKVYDGTSDPAKVYDTLAVIGRPSTDESRVAAPARDSLKGVTFYPVSVSYFEQGGVDRAPTYVMTSSLYANGVVGALKIDYGRFALVGAMSRFETVADAGGCAK